jgi:endonuclease-3
MATPSKAQFLTSVHDLLKKRYKPKADRHPSRLTVLEAVVYGVCHEGMTREAANQAMARFKDRYFDWNEVRVSSLAEITETLSGFPDAEERARRIRKFLNQLFQKTYGFNLEPLVKKPLKEALKVLHDYEAFSSDFVTATVIQQALGGHAIPVDEEVRRALARLGVAEADAASLRSALERAVPKNRGVEFLDLIEDLAHDTCVPGIPDCPRCELRRICPYPQAHKADIQAAHAKPGTSKAIPAKAHPSHKAPKATPKDGAPPAAKAAPPAAPKSTPAKSVKKPEAPPKGKQGRPKA